jgi:hypothetical protein
MQDIMAWVYEKFEDEVYTNLKDHKEFIEEYIEREKIELNPKNQKALLDPKTWQAQLDIMNAGESLMKELGQEQYDDFNLFSEKLEEATKKLKLKLSASEKNQIINAISWRNESAAKIVKKVHKLSPAKLKDVLEKLNITEDKLQDYGYWKTKNTGEYIEYEADSELRDTENIPLKQDIHDYFIKEVRAHVDEAWIDISKTQIGYEISFNRYFYQHQPLRSLDEVTADILKLEEETDGLLKKLISLAANPKKQRGSIMQEIKGLDRNIQNLLSAGSYSIDYYQREYKWKTKQLTELVNDLSARFLENYSDGDQPKQVAKYGHYFLGSIVVSKQGEKRQIVDGQQRLTTLTLLLIYLNNLQADSTNKVSISSLIYDDDFGEKKFRLSVPERNSCMEALFNDEKI